MVLRPRNGISLCAGGGGLELGLQLAEPDFACRCFVEADADAKAVLLAGMAPDTLDRLAREFAALRGSDDPDAAAWLAANTGRFARPFHKAALWSDVRTFVADGWRGHIDLVSAGYPCQPFSAAGKRAGSDDPRHLWPDVLRIWVESGAPWGFFENVAGHISLGLETVLRDIWDVGGTPAVGLFSSGQTSNTHERQRVFIVAYRQGVERRSELQSKSAGRRWSGPTGDGQELAHTDLHDRRTDDRQPNAGADRGHLPRREGGDVDYPKQLGRSAGWNRDHGKDERQLTDAESGAVAHSSCGAGYEGSAGHGRSGVTAGDQREATRAFGSRPYLQPPGPSDHGAWGAVLHMAPHLAPSVAFRDLVSRANDLAAMVAEGRLAETQAQSSLRRLADAMAQRPRILRLDGNGVDPLVSGYAWRTLSAAHGLRPLDLEATLRNH